MASTCVEVSPEQVGSPPIGRPIANVAVYVLDGYGEPVPVGVAGELCLGGASVARGYHQRPGLSAERFRPNPFGVGRLYHTGDLGRYLPDGALEFLGRMDSQVQLRGFRIELGEIEVVLGQHPDVEEVAVVLRDESSGPPHLVAYVVCRDERDLEVAQWRRFLRDQLPEYMVPAVFVSLDALPLTPNGKVDRRPLPAPDASSLSAATAYAAPRTVTEATLATIWAEVLGREQVGIHDDFFALGGHSLMATQVVSRIQDALGVRLPIRALFEQATISGLAERVETFSPPNAMPEAIQPVSRSGPLPLSFGQQRLWFLDQLGSGAAYHIPLTLRLQGSLDVAALHRTLTEIVRRHESLRTTFRTESGTPHQVIQPPAPVPMPVVDLSPLPDEAQAAEIQRRAQEESLRPFDLAADRMLRATLLRQSPQTHVLLLTLHHIASDGWSMGVLVREVSRLYEAFTQGLPSPLPELPIQYADFAHWQRQWLQGAVLEQQLAYWREQLTGAPPLLALPTDRPRPGVQTHNGAGEGWALGIDLTRQVHALSQATGTTVFMTLLAAFTVLLARHSGQEDLVVGAPIANRTRVETEGLIGCFLNTLALRVNVSGNPTFRELLAQVQQMTQEAYEHQDVPFEQVIDELQPERNPSHNPIVQVAFALQNAPMDEFALPSLRVHALDPEVHRVHTDLEWYVWERDDVLAGGCTYNRDLFDASTMARLVAHFQTLLSGIVSNPDQRIATLPLLSETERHEVLVGWNATRTGYPTALCIHQVVEGQVEVTPDAVAVVWGDQALTYRALNARANQVAHYLRSLGVGADVRVGLCLERSLEMVVGLLGILKAGGAYVPLDPQYPRERLAFMLQDAHAQVVLTQASLLPELPLPSLPVICLDRDGAELAAWPRTNPAPVAGPEHLAYVIYTSGSTGQPKGVLTTHGNLLNFAWWHIRTYAVTAADRVTQVASVAFDAAAGEWWPHLAVGASVHLVEPDRMSDPPAFQAWLLTHQITLSFVPTVVAEQLIGLEWPRELALRALLTGGDKLHQGPEATLPFTFVNNYGPTENTVASTCALVPSGETVSPPIGRPIANVAVYVLDGYGEPVPVGVAGELCLGGASVARGYHQRPGLSAERFRPNPFGAGRLYHTGDLGRYLPDGALEFLGRLDSQVQLRGFRIELGEIEAVLGQHPAVQEVAVVLREESSGPPHLVAYVVSREEGEADGAEWRRFLRDQLPEYMVPSLFVSLDALPLTPNGKVDRRALPAPDASSFSAATAYAAPRTATEATLATIWGEVLGREQVGIHDDFFALGGHSLLSIQMIARIQNAFGIRLPVRTIFEQATVAGLAGLVETLSTSGETPDAEGSVARAGNLPPSVLFVELHQGNSGKQPFFLLHPVGGSVLCYRHLAQHLGVEQPVYGIQARGLEGEGVPFVDLEEMAGHYVSLLQAVQSQGPYQLGGWSLGGLVALEMAQQLHHQGQEVSLLALIDSFAPIDSNELDEAELVAYFARDLGGVSGRAFSVTTDEFRPLSSEEQLQHLVVQARKQGVLPPEVGAEYIRHRLQVFKANIQAVARYRPHPYAGRIIFFYNSAVMQVHQDASLVWRSIATGDIITHEISGDHYSIVQSQMLAEKLRVCLHDSSEKET
ncbi:MAG: amino acid adenylation domain-containing protein [Candidatus Tectomicrobia bacterium]|nr:amino acid adenylation domain-containing protein [Candidatus Tectomicrobia bacterium]